MTMNAYTTFVNPITVNLTTKIITIISYMSFNHCTVMVKTTAKTRSLFGPSN